MARRNPRSPAHNAYSRAIIEEAEIINVNRKTWTVDVETRHSAKTVEDIAWLSPYHHYKNGEGFHHIPEVGALVHLCFPSDNTPPFVLGYLPAASQEASSGEEEVRPSETGEEGSTTTASFRSGRPSLSPGDISITGRDDNYVILRRGGVVQVGSTQTAQRLYLPITNVIQDFCENYKLTTIGGDLGWTVGRNEDDPSGEAPVQYVLHVHEHAQEAKATVRIRHFPLSSGEGSDKTAYEITIAPQGIDKNTEEVVGETYKLLVTLGGDVSQFIGGSHTAEITGDSNISVGGRAVCTRQ